MNHLDPSNKADTTEAVRDFFNDLSGDYTAAIDRCVPRYREMLAMLLNYLPDRPYPRILELGCGTGNLSEGIARRFPQSGVVLLDLSPDILNECRQRFEQLRINNENITWQEADFSSVQFPDASFDLVLSSIALHHLTSDEKLALFKSVNRWLAAGGVFSYSDQFAGAAADVYEKHMQNWHAAAMELGATEDDWTMWMQHQDAHDHHDSLADQMRWLTEAGFHDVDCPWRYVLWTVLQARK